MSSQRIDRASNIVDVSACGTTNHKRDSKSQTFQILHKLAAQRSAVFSTIKVAHPLELEALIVALM